MLLSIWWVVALFSLRPMLKVSQCENKVGRKCNNDNCLPHNQWQVTETHELNQDNDNSYVAYRHTKQWKISRRLRLVYPADLKKNIDIKGNARQQRQQVPDIHKPYNNKKRSHDLLVHLANRGGGCVWNYSIHNLRWSEPASGCCAGRALALVKCFGFLGTPFSRIVRA